MVNYLHYPKQAPKSPTTHSKKPYICIRTKNIHTPLYIQHLNSTLKTTPKTPLSACRTMLYHSFRCKTALFSKNTLKMLFLIPVFNKADLCRALGLCAPSGKIYYAQLRKMYLTDQLLREVGLDAERYKKISKFPRPINERIAQSLGLTSQHFQRA